MSNEEKKTAMARTDVVAFVQKDNSKSRKELGKRLLEMGKMLMAEQKTEALYFKGNVLKKEEKSHRDSRK